MVGLFSDRRGVAAVLLVLLFLALWRTPAWAGGQVADRYGGRDMIVYVPTELPPAGSRARAALWQEWSARSPVFRLAGRAAADRSKCR